MSGVRRVYVEKKEPYAVAARQLKEDIESFLGIDRIRDVRILIRYDVENISDETFEKGCRTVFSEPPVDILYREKIEIPEGTCGFSVEALPGQFDQRADSAEQCLQFLNEEEKPVVRTAVTYLLAGDLSKEEIDRIKAYCINPVDSRETGLEKPQTLRAEYPEPDDVQVLSGFIFLEQKALKELYDSLGLAMTFADFAFIRQYFGETEHRDPTITEIRVLDTYWSDHCRHTTFSTELKNITFEDGYYRTPIETTWQSYADTRAEMYAGRADKPVCLMDLAIMGMKKLKADGKLTDMEESEENNACSVVVPIEVDYGRGPQTEEWLVFFKNETHNHPTEIEPFGGAATCLGGAIRDPLSGRGYVYQAMRVTGAADPTAPVSETIPGKLPQKKLVIGAADGYSSYGNQIGLATGQVAELYHPGYLAKRMEIGAVMGAAARENVRRISPAPGDVIILLGGRTGRDGIGGATGSSKAHTEESLTSCGAEVQKGNAPTERKLQRLFRRPEVSHMIKKCNDFGAGGVSVAIGELADGLEVNLDLVPKKYEGLDGTELAISESQERMAVVVAPEDEKQFLAYAAEENLEATPLAHVTAEPRLVLKWRGKPIVDIARAFLDTNGAHQETDVDVRMPSEEGNYFRKTASAKVGEILEQEKEARNAEPDREDVSAPFFSAAVREALSDLNVCSQKGLVEMFDASIGAATVTMPYGGRYQLTPTQAMTAKLPVLGGTTDTVSMMSYGFDPYLSSWSPYHGAIYAVVQSMSKIVASGGDYRNLHFTFQEYFGRMSEDPVRWSQPFTALLGAYDAQIGFGLASIGGKDSMSGTFREKGIDIDVPPTLVSFAVDVAKAGEIVTPELKRAGDILVQLCIERDEFDVPVYDDVTHMYELVTSLMRDGKICAAYALDSSGILPAAAKMAFGNGFGVAFVDKLRMNELFENAMGDLLVEMSPDDLAFLSDVEGFDWYVVGTVTGKENPVFTWQGAEILLDEMLAAWKKPLEKVFPSKSADDPVPFDAPLYTQESAQHAGAPAGDGRGILVDAPVYTGGQIAVCGHRIAQPTVFIPVFPGTNCEYDTAAAFERAGARTVTRVFTNLTARDIRDSAKAYADEIRKAQIIMFPGGFSAGDEPDGSAKFFATAFRNALIEEAVRDLLDNRDGLILGICNGFQALIKLGLVPNGAITGQDEQSPTLTFNTIGRHISKMAYTRVCSNKSPWLALAEPGGVYVNPASHGEGRFVAPDAWIKKLEENGQIATRYSDPDGNVSMDEEWNINGSYAAIEGITSPDGRVFGKMVHCERSGSFVNLNIEGNQDMRLFEAGVKYFA
ncbi:MAG: phosphoribosylformylglycinamidine synthase [Eubacteriales bacterium]|nr:phosphoribosylformylglycinamidine synthase [Eubacteriales bacterium]